MADLVLFRPRPPRSTKSLTQIVTELNSVLAAANLDATASRTANLLKIESDTGSMDSAVVVTPAPPGDLTQTLTLGRAWGGTEVSGSAGLRPASTPSGARIGRGPGRSDVGPARSSRRRAAAAHTRSDSLLFPRFNLLCLPGLTSTDDVADQRRARLLRGASGRS